MFLINNKKLKFLYVLWLVFTMTGCQSWFNTPSKPKSDLPKKVKGASDEKIVAMQTLLNKQDIKVISMGQNYLISIPSAKLFADQSPRLTWNSYASLNEVIEFIKQFRTVSIHVRSFSSKYVSARREHALTLARSRAVADYMQSQGIDTRFIFMSGLGSDKPVMAYYEGGDSSGNSRVEITFRRQVA